MTADAKKMAILRRLQGKHKKKRRGRKSSHDSMPWFMHESGRGRHSSGDGGGHSSGGGGSSHS